METGKLLRIYTLFGLLVNLFLIVLITLAGFNLVTLEEIGISAFIGTLLSVLFLFNALFFPVVILNLTNEKC